MKINGHQIKEQLKLKKLELAALNSRFNDSLYAFEDEKQKKGSPAHLSLDILKCEGEIARLKFIQCQYNMQAQCIFDGTTLPLQEAVNSISGFGRMAKMWRTLATKEESTSRRRRWISVPSAATRKADEVTAEAQYNSSEALANVLTYQAKAARLSAAIGKANLTEIEVEQSDEKLFTGK